MLGPYRDPVLVEADPLPHACVPEGAGARCPYGAPAAVPPAPWIPSGFAKALSAAATLLLLVGSASVAATTWTVVSTVLSTRRQIVTAEASPTRSPRSLPPPLAAWGPETHQVEALWTRAEQIAAAGSDLTLARATLAPGTVADAGDLAWRLHEKSRRGHAGLRIVDLDEGSPAALVGLRKGDLVTAINGFALRRPQDAVRANMRLAATKGAVVELVRSGRRVVLRVDWRP